MYFVYYGTFRVLLLPSSALGPAHTTYYWPLLAFAVKSITAPRNTPTGSDRTDYRASSGPLTYRFLLGNCWVSEIDLWKVNVSSMPGLRRECAVMVRRRRSSTRRKEGRKEGDVLRHPFVLNRSSRKCSEHERAGYYVHTWAAALQEDVRLQFACWATIVYVLLFTFLPLKQHGCHRDGARGAD